MNNAFRKTYAVLGCVPSILGKLFSLDGENVPTSYRIIPFLFRNLNGKKMSLPPFIATEVSCLSTMGLPGSFA